MSNARYLPFRNVERSMQVNDRLLVTTFAVLTALTVGLAAGPAAAQPDIGAAQCEKCIQSGMSIYQRTRDEEAAYCSKIGMCPTASETKPRVLTSVEPKPAAAQVPRTVAPTPPPVQVAAPAARAPTVSGNVAPNGSYQCWYFSSARGGLNFTLTGGGHYTDVQGKQGTVALSPAGMTFSGGALSGQKAQYRGGNPPTIKILGPRGDEVSSCQLKR